MSAPSSSNARSIFVRLFPLVWQYRARIVVALVFLVLAKLSSIGLPLLFKQIVDALDANRHALLLVPLALIAGYGALRLRLVAVPGVATGRVRARHGAHVATDHLAGI